MAKSNLHAKLETAIEIPERMDGPDPAVRRPTLKERLGFNSLKALGCCGVALGLGPTTITDQDTEGPQIEIQIDSVAAPAEIGPPAAWAVTGMNLAAALAAERQLRAVLDSDPPGTPARVSLMRLLEETEDAEEGGGGCGWVCCVCMGRKKGAAFIPCGHTFCRVCSRELWLNRGSCPLCNRPILEILDIY